MTWKAVRKGALLAGAVTMLVMPLLLAGCGSGDDGEQFEAVERERDEAADELNERITELQREFDRSNRNSQDAEEPAAATSEEPAPATPAPDPPPESGSIAAGGMGDWPGGTGHTVILASLGSETEARSAQRKATSSGLDAGVLFSSHFRSLRPGYWVVFSGVFDSNAEAAQRVDRATSLGYNDAYPRFVAP